MQTDRNAVVPVVIYAAKSTADPKGSIPTQLADCAASVEREGGRVVVGEYSDEGKSAYKGNRGDGLAAAKEHAATVAAEAGRAELWVQHSDRLARGDGLTADHLAEVYFAMRRAGVVLRSVQDDSNLEDVIRVALIGERNTEDSRRKSEAVRSGKARQFERGERMGGPVPDGYSGVAVVEAGVAVKRLELDPGRESVLRRMFELAAEGLGDPSIARRLNAEGYRTKAGKPWTRRRVQDTLTNQHYAGRVVRGRGTPDEQVADGRHPALIDPAAFDALLAARGKRDKAAGSARSPKGRPPTNSALAKLAVCGRCGERMYAVTSTYRRKDGSKARHYTCPSYKNSTGTCDQPKIDAADVDAAVVAHLDGFFIDFDGWIASLAKARSGERDALAIKLATERDRLAKLDSREALATERMLSAAEAGDREAEAQWVKALHKVERDRERVAKAVVAMEDALEAVSEPEPVDAMLDAFNALAEAVRGRVKGDTVAEVNVGLRELFERFTLDATPEGVTVMPVLHENVEWVVEPAPMWPLDQRARLRKVEGAAGPVFPTRTGETPPLKRLAVLAEQADENLLNTHA